MLRVIISGFQQIFYKLIANFDINLLIDELHGNCVAWSVQRLRCLLLSWSHKNKLLDRTYVTMLNERLFTFSITKLSSAKALGHWDVYGRIMSNGT